MDKQLKSAEQKLDEVFVKKAPYQIPEKGRKAIVKYLPWVTLVLAFFMLMSTYWLWSWAHTANTWIDWANDVSRAYGGGNAVASSSRITFIFWVGIGALLVEGLMYLAAFPGLKEQKKQGWNLLFYAALLNIVYSVVMLFSAYSGFGDLVFTIIGTAIGLYILFQIRGHYNGKAAQKK